MTLPFQPIRIGGEHRAADPRDLADREWMLADGLGGWSSGTALGPPTRKYHGLLVAAVSPPHRRHLYLSRLLERVETGGEVFDLSDGGLAPSEFRHGGHFVRWRYRLTGDVELDRRVTAVHGGGVIVSWRLLAGDGRLWITPMCPFRSIHSLRRTPHYCYVEQAGRAMRIGAPAGMPPLFLAADREFQWIPAEGSPDGTVLAETYPVERARGYEDTELVPVPGTIVVELADGQHFRLAAAAGEPPPHPETAENRQAMRFSHLRKEAPEAIAAHPVAGRLWEAADAFLVTPSDGPPTAIAGYPWFTDWGRDTLISLPGLALVTGRHKLAVQVIESYAGAMAEGLAPKRWTEDGQAEYDAADTTLWLFEAVAAYLRYAKAPGKQPAGKTEGEPGSELAERLFPALSEVANRLLVGTRYGIGVDRHDGLYTQGAPGKALTWMDAVLHGAPVTPRRGKAVELNALWYSAQLTLAELCALLNRPGEDAWRERAARTAASMLERFWDPDRSCLVDVVDGQDPVHDSALRPNQVFALSAEHPVLVGDRAEEVLAALDRELVTPLGLRTLSRHHTSYYGSYRGDVTRRDQAYHQGTVWPWLLGPYWRGLVRTLGPAGRVRALAGLNALAPHLEEAGLGSVSEVADGEPPHTPGGCPWQAWSVAEILRAAAEDIFDERNDPSCS